VGHVHELNILNEKSLKSAIEYIHNNPVRKKLAGKPTDWKYSSARWYENQEVGPVAVDSIPL
jgi:REP-associated tyrosine transposase